MPPTTLKGSTGAARQSRVQALIRSCGIQSQGCQVRVEEMQSKHGLRPVDVIMIGRKDELAMIAGLDVGVSAPPRRHLRLPEESGRLVHSSELVGCM